MMSYEMDPSSGVENPQAGHEVKALDQAPRGLTLADQALLRLARYGGNAVLSKVPVLGPLIKAGRALETGLVRAEDVRIVSEVGRAAKSVLGKDRVQEPQSRTMGLINTALGPQMPPIVKAALAATQPPIQRVKLPPVAARRHGRDKSGRDSHARTMDAPRRDVEAREGIYRDTW